MKLPIKEQDVPWESWYVGTDREIRGKAICDVGGDSKVGVGILELPPGSNTKPAHFHSLEEEHLYVLDGNAILYLGSDTYN